MVRILSCICRKKETIMIFQKLFETFRNAEMLTDVRGKKKKANDRYYYLCNEFVGLK